MHFQSQQSSCCHNSWTSRSRAAAQHQESRRRACHPFSLVNLFMLIIFSCMRWRRDLIHVVFYRLCIVLRNTCFVCTQRMHVCQKWNFRVTRICTETKIYSWHLSKQHHCAKRLIRPSSVLGGLKISMLLPELKYIRFLLILQFLGFIGVP